MSAERVNEPDSDHRRPEGVSDETVEALGVLSEALERTHRARGHLYSWHQLTGSADAGLDRAVELLRSAGHQEIADRIERELIGLNVIQGRWTFQALEADARERLAGGRPHLYEAELKQKRRSPGLPGHETAP
jgi:hypothetical protein